MPMSAKRLIFSNTTAARCCVWVSPSAWAMFQGNSAIWFMKPRGVAVVIAPWNFPLAISMGMTSAAIVTGNTVVYKPASQSPVIGSMVYELFKEAKLPPGVLNFLPGSGSEIGDHLVAHPEVALIAFTGSKETGLHILELASQNQRACARGQNRDRRNGRQERHHRRCGCGPR